MINDYSIHVVIAVILVAGIVGLIYAIDEFKGMEDEEWAFSLESVQT